MKPRIGLAVVAHPNEVGFAEAAGLLRDTAAALAGAGEEWVVHPAVVTEIDAADEAFERFYEARLDGLVILTATWSDDFLAVRLVKRLGVPALTWARRGVHTGSLCGTQQLDQVLAELGLPFVFCLGEPDDPEVRRLIAEFARAAGLRSRLQNLRVGLLGHRNFGMTEIAVDELELRRRLGPEVVPLSSRRFAAAVEAITDAAAEAGWAAAQAGMKNRATPAAGRQAAKVLLALNEWRVRHRLGAVAVDCYPDYMGRFCLAAARLAAEDFVVACEGDVNGAVAQVMMHGLTGGPTHNTDLLDVDDAAGTALFSHCGAGHPSLAADPGQVTLAPVRLAEEGLCVLFPGKPGPVTLVNLVGRAGTYRMGVLEGEAVATDLEFPGNPVRVRLPGGGRAFLDFVARHALGHHWMIGYGHVARPLAWLAEWSGVSLRRGGE